MALLQFRYLNPGHLSSQHKKCVTSQSGVQNFNPYKLNCKHTLCHRRTVDCRALVLNVLNDEYERFNDDDEFLAEFPSKFELLQRLERPKPLVRVRLSVHYRVHSRQMLCIGGSHIPFGWSFLSIAKVPMTWNSGDVWTCEVDLQAGQRVEYKYVILEEQDWTKQENEDSEGLVEITYRTGSQPGIPPDSQVIQKQMAIVAWQPGPNRILQVPTEDEIQQVQPGDVVERSPPRSQQRLVLENDKGQRVVASSNSDPYDGTWEVIRTDDEGRPFLDRHDVWGWGANAPFPQILRSTKYES